MLTKQPLLTVRPLVYGTTLASLVAGLTAASAQPAPSSTSLLPGIPYPPPVRAEGGHRPQARKLPDGRIILRNPHLAAVVLRGEQGYRAVALYPAPRPGTEAEEPEAVATFAQLTGDDPSNAVASWSAGEAVLRGDHAVALTGTADAGGTTWTVTTTLTIEDEPWVSWEVRARPAGAGKLSRFVPLSLFTGGPGPRELLFPGVTFLEGAETLPGGPLVPDPLRITVPMMAQSQGRVSTGLLWSPRQPWGGSGLPGALLEPSVPERDETASRMELFVPAAGSPPVSLAAGGEIRLSGKLFLRREAERPTSALRRWVDAYPLTETTYPRSFAAERRLSRSAFTGSLWVPSVSGWKYSSAANDAQPYPFGVQALLLDAAQAENPGAAAELRRQADQVLAALQQQGPLPEELAYRVGGVPESLEAERDQVTELIREQLPDGSWPPPVGRRVPDQPDQVPVAPPGLVAENAVRLLRFAALTGDSSAAGAGRRAADLLLPVRVPRSTMGGAPDLAAAVALAECYLLAYQVTGERDYVEPARYWAEIGLTFAYLWGDPVRAGQQFATVPVFPNASGGGTILTSQPAGLELARVLLKLDRVRPDDLYTKAAAGILAAAMRQQSADGADAGLLPEQWDVREGRGVGAKLNPWPLLRVLYQLEHLDPDVSHARARTGADRLFIASGATIENVYTTTMRLRLKLRSVRGGDSFVTVTGVPALPMRVEYNSDSLLPFGIVKQPRFLPESTGGSEPGWFYDLETGFLMIRLRHTGDDDHLEVRWPDPRERVPVQRVDRKVESRR